MLHTDVLFKDDPFIFLSQARQVFFVQDAKDKDWAIIVKTKPKELYDMGKQLEDDDDDDTNMQSMPYNCVSVDDVDATLPLVRMIFEEDAIA